MRQIYIHLLLTFLFLCICWSIQTIDGGRGGGGGSRGGGGGSRGGGGGSRGGGGGSRGGGGGSRGGGGGSRGGGGGSRGGSGGSSRSGSGGSSRSGSGGSSRSSFRESSSSRSSYRGSSGFRSSSSRSSSSSYRRVYYTTRYSYSWKTRAYSHHYVYVGRYHSWDYSRSDRVEEWNICFNLVFSGANNTPIIDISSSERLRDLSDSEYELAMDRVINVSLHLMPSSNEADAIDELLPTDEKDFTKPWQYIGLFVCPMFPSESNYKYCCGEDEFQYCCTSWESWREFPWLEIFYVSIACGLISCAIYSYVKKRRRRLARLREMELAAAAEAEAAVAPAPDPTTGTYAGPENTQPLLDPYNANNPPIGFLAMQNEGMKNQESNYGMPPTWPPPSEASAPPPYPPGPPPSYEFASQSKA